MPFKVCPTCNNHLSDDEYTYQICLVCNPLPKGYKTIAEFLNRK